MEVDDIKEGMRVMIGRNMKERQKGHPARVVSVSGDTVSLSYLSKVTGRRTLYDVSRKYFERHLRYLS